MFALAAAGKLTVKTKEVSIKNIADIWNMEVANGERLVVML
jgi:hypothetical protein